MVQGGNNDQGMVRKMTTLIRDPCLEWWRARLLEAIYLDMEGPPAVVEQPD